jgi:integrase
MKRRTLAPGVYEDASGITARVRRGSGAQQAVAQERFPRGTSLKVIRAWQVRARAKLAKRRSGAARGTLRAGVAEYQRLADLTAVTLKRRTQQQNWWCAQLAAVGAPVMSPQEFSALDPNAPLDGRRLGECRRDALDPQRLREILQVAFAADDESDPTARANTSNHYRTALYHLFTVLDQDDPEAINPLARVKVRQRAAPKPSGQDARVVREILKHVPSKFGKSGKVSELRLGVLAWIHITPTQLMGVEPLTDFHDVPDATREQIIGGAITLTKQARLKGRKGKTIPAPETIPLNPWGVEAMRKFAAYPPAHGKFSMSPLNKVFKRACARAQAALAKAGVVVDLSAMTLYHLKHSLASTASIASAGLVDRRGRLQQALGVSKALDHADPRTTMIYTGAAVDPLVRQVNAATSVFLAQLFKTPLNPAAALRVVHGSHSANSRQ